MLGSLDAGEVAVRPGPVTHSAVAVIEFADVAKFSAITEYCWVPVVAEKRTMFPVPSEMWPPLTTLKPGGQTASEVAIRHPPPLAGHCAAAGPFTGISCVIPAEP
jgi:hypothetical protein